MAITVPQDVMAACSVLINAGFQAYLVGGAIRDSLLRLQPTDWDIATDALPEDVERLFDRTVPTGRQFGTITVVGDGRSLEVTTMRSDGVYRDRRRPEEVEFTDRIELDLARRDFTINAIAYDPDRRQLIDPFGGKKDLRRKLLRTVGSPNERFAEDPLRMLRLVRFQSVLGFKGERKTELAVEARLITYVSPERILIELNKILMGRFLQPALEFFYHSGLMEEIIPELASSAGISAGDNHPFDLLGHSIMAASFAEPDVGLRWAALLHDVGKQVTLKREHSAISAEMAKDILTRLRASRKLIGRVTTLIAEHMFDIHPQSSDRAIRRFMARVGTETAFDLIKLRQADLAGLNENPRHILAYRTAMEGRLNDILSQKGALTLSDLAVNGHVITAELGLKPGPKVGLILNYLLDRVWSDPSLNRPGQLLELARSYLKTLG
ncbi:MAG: HD domain-containing protein [Bacillota bacterium]|jgi:tRNA nucleotidyltransferase/poly(A) polymerase|nr:HD domain-containing protein [Bacillota bacterium]